MIVSTKPSGRFVLRVPPAMHEALRTAARDVGLSLNEYCVRKLGSPAPPLEGVAPAVTKAMSVAGGGLVGVIAFGSWARLELRADSDVDLLVVVEPGLEVNRALYQDWDRAPLEWGEHRVEPHFVHLPDPADRISGLWAEVALDGIVLFERDLELSRRLIELRHRIMDGGWARRVAHGQPYWVEVA